MTVLDLKIKKRSRPDVQSMHAYAIQDAASMVKLNAMENPHRLPAELQVELGQRTGALALNRYPDGRVNDLRRAMEMPAGFDNLLLVRVPDAGRAFEGLRNCKVLVKNVSKMHPLLANCLRLTMGTADDNTQLLAALKESL
jgi:histidinol-phosphate/aromatic aminotransferase/cobyric acid decarboxylase-like protein